MTAPANAMAASEGLTDLDMCRWVCSGHLSAEPVAATKISCLEMAKVQSPPAVCQFVESDCTGTPPGSQHKVTTLEQKLLEQA